MKFIKNKILPNGSRLVIARLDMDIINHVWDIKLNPEELNKYRAITNDKRKCEFLSIRKSIQTLYDENEYIAYSYHGKPNLAISGHKISISHSKGLLGILIHPVVEVGIDLQHETPKIIKIKNRFMSPEELISSKGDEWQLLTYWCAKEALYKYYSKGNVEFNKNLFVEPFELNKQGFLTGKINMPDMVTQLPMGYHIIEDTMVVFTMEES
jgi:4'-phosphopantetheinyl transferase EntD